MRPNGRARGCANLPNRWERDMLKKFTNIHGAGRVAAIAAATMAVLSPISAGAHTAKPSPFKEASITLENHHGAETTIVVGHDGEKYTHIKTDQITARFKLKAKVKVRHRITGFVVTTEDPANEGTLPDHVKGAEKVLFQRKLDSFSTFRMDVATALSTGIWQTTPIEPITEQSIIDSCNARFSDLPETKQRLLDPIELTIHAGFSAGKKGIEEANLDGNWYNNNSRGRPAIAHTTLPVKIICQGFRRAVLPTPPPPRAGNELYSVDLKVDQHGERCPKDVTVTAYANYKWQAKSRMRLKVGGGFPKVRLAKTKKVTFAGKTFHRAVAEFKYKLDPGQKTFKLVVDQGEKKHTETIEITCPSFKVLSAWLKYDVEDKSTCSKKVTETATYHTTRPGWVKHEIRMEGGFVVSSGKLTAKRVGDKYVATAVRHLTMNAIDKEFIADAVDYPANSGWVPLKVACLKVLSGTLEQRGLAANRCKGEAAFSIRTNGPGEVPYRLECTGGRAWTGKVQAHKTGPNTYIGVEVVDFDVSNNELVRCALRTRKPLPFKILGGDKRTYACHKTTGASGSADLVTETRPDAQQPQGRGLVIDAGPRGKAVDATPDTGKSRRNAEAKRHRLEALKKKREARKRAAERRKKAKEKAAKLRRKREAAKKKAAALKRKREAAKKKAAALKRKLKAAEARRKRQAKRSELVQ
jgi:hypothetical protein